MTELIKTELTKEWQLVKQGTKFQKPIVGRVLCALSSREKPFVLDGIPKNIPLNYDMEMRLE